MTPLSFFLTMSSATRRSTRMAAHRARDRIRAIYSSPPRAKPVRKPLQPDLHMYVMMTLRAKMEELDALADKSLLTRVGIIHEIFHHLVEHPFFIIENVHFREVMDHKINDLRQQLRYEYFLMDPPASVYELEKTMATLKTIIANVPPTNQI